MQSLEWYLNRAKAMPPKELAARALRQLRFGAERAGLLRGEPPQATTGADGIALPLEHLERIEPARYIEAAEQVLGGTFEFFGRRFELGFPPRWNVDPLTGTQAPLTFGKTLDYRDSRVVGDAKHLWELNRHLETVTLAQAYRLTGNPRYLDGLRVLITSWIEQCPPMKGANWCSSLELGIRLMNWHLAYLIIGGRDALTASPEGREFETRWLASIYRHMHFVMHHRSTHASSANNHLIGELVGVHVACCTWPRWPVAHRWLEQTERGLEQEIRRQVHPDGVDREQTTWYQQFVASMLMLSALAAARAGRPMSTEYHRRLRRMLAFLAALTDAGGRIPMIGDADDGIAFMLEPRPGLEPFKALLGLGATVFGVSAWRELATGAEDTAKWLGEAVRLPAPDEPPMRRGASAVRFGDGGYTLFGRALGGRGEIRILFDSGPLGFPSIAGHGHADALSLLLTVHGREQLIDPGTYAYHSERRWRDYFRGTAAHNTVRVDGEDQSRIGGPFLWLRHAQTTLDTFERVPGGMRVVGSHDGYMRLPDPVKHVREVRYLDNETTLEITDRLICRGEHRIERFWHFGEQCAVRLTGRAAESADGDIRVRVEVEEEDSKLYLLVGSSEPIGGWVSRGFGVKTPAPTLRVANTISGETVLRTRIVVQASQPAAPRAETTPAVAPVPVA